MESGLSQAVKGRGKKKIGRAPKFSYKEWLPGLVGSMEKTNGTVCVEARGEDGREAFDCRTVFKIKPTFLSSLVIWIARPRIRLSINGKNPFSWIKMTTFQENPESRGYDQWYCSLNWIVIETIVMYNDDIWAIKPFLPISQEG